MSSELRAISAAPDDPIIISRQWMRALYLRDYPNRSPGERLWHVTRQTFDGSWQVTIDSSWQVAIDNSHHLDKQSLASSLGLEIGQVVLHWASGIDLDE
jgi:hypothetical protein